MRILLFLVALVALYSCNNNLDSIGQDLIDNGNYVEMKEFEIENTYTVKIDSFYTSAAYATGSYAINEMFVGKYTDRYSGTTTAKACFQITNSYIPSIDKIYVLDSVTFNFTFSGKIWGDTINPQLQTFELYQLEESPVLNLKDDNLFYNTHPIYPGKLLSSVKFYPLRGNMRKTYFKLDTEYGKKLGQEIFEKMQYQDQMFKDYPFGFINYFKGLAIVPAESNNCIFNISALTDSLYMRFHFHKTEDKSVFDLRLAQKEYQFNQILNDPAPALAVLKEGQIKKVSFKEAGIDGIDDYVLMQGLAGYMIKMNLPKPPIPNEYSTIIKAEIELVPKVFAKASLAMPSTVAVYQSDDRNAIRGVLANSSTTSVTGQYVTSPISSEYNRYVFDVTDYYQRLTQYPGDLDSKTQVLMTIPNLSTSFNQTIIDKIPVLKIYYASYNNNTINRK